MWPPLHTTKMYNLHTNRTYAYYKILIEPKKQSSKANSVFTYGYARLVWTWKTLKKNECVKGPPHSVIYFLQLRQKVSLIASAYSLYRHRSVLDLTLNYWPAVYKHFEKLVYCVFYYCCSLIFKSFTR